MKKLYKRVLAALLCLALMAAIVPATAFAWGDHSPNDEDELAYWLELGFIPGELRVTLYEQCYTIDNEVYVGLEELLPEIEIEEYLDNYLCVLTAEQRETIAKRDPEYAAMIGKSFHIRLVEKTAEATEAAIEALKDNPYVKRAGKIIIVKDPYDVIYPDNPIEPEDEITVGDALKALRVAAGLQEATAELVAAYDTDGDGEITVADALTVLRIAAKLA